ncbi:IclR family transcriptional regulator [Dactylosporangium sp. NPDC051484]|uniref:IclR family transcriptional regulator n=1 Tax=Dactylosporangium sp. NPDC051484 TaxID=3154942 RepID=UPI00344F3F41
MRNQTGGTLSSVDNALRVLELLSVRTSLRVIEVADHLGVARSTAHRILAALLARGFVVQDAHKIYRPGPAIERFRLPHLGRPRATEDLVHPHLERLAAAVGETCHVAVLEGNGTRFLDSVESFQALRVGNRIGMLLPAHKTAIGIVLLAELPLTTLRSIYPRGLTGDAREAKQTLVALEGKIRTVRRTGYAVNMGDSDVGICAIGMCLRDPFGRAFAGIAIAIPTPRFDRKSTQELVRELSNTAEAVRQEMAQGLTLESPVSSGGAAHSPLADN